jgi:RsiW-degrading membrane proteinase PrsW (M82 family)
LLANQGLAGLWAKSEGVKFASDWSASLSAPLNEELLKLCGVVMVALAAPLAINGPLDGLVYGALTGLGFQAAENVTYGLNAIVMSGGTSPNRAVLDSALLRVGTVGFGSHWTMTAVAGAGAGYLILHTRRRRLMREARHAGYPSRQPADAPPARPGYGLLLAAAACLAAAVGMHLLFDAPAVAVEIKAAANFALAATLYLLLSSAFLHRARELLAGAAAAGRLSTADAGSVLSRRRRRRELRRTHPPAERDKLRARQQDILAELDAEAN